VVTGEPQLSSIADRTEGGRCAHSSRRAVRPCGTGEGCTAPILPCEVTVKSHIGRIFTKLDLRDRAAAIVYAFDRGLVSPGGTP
jgi:hypothetical protein